MADIKDQLIKDSYNYVLQSDLTTGVIYRIGGSVPIFPTFISGLTVNSGFTYSNGTEQNGYVLTCDSSGNANWEPSGEYLPLSGGTVTGGTIFQSGLTANTISATTYYNLPTDIFVTGGTYNSGDVIFTNNTGGTFTVTGFAVGGGGGQLFYLNLSQSQNGNRLLSTTASTASEQTTGVTINNGVTGSIASFQSQPLNITLLPGGIWSFYLHSYKENNNASFDIFVEVYKRTSGGTQTLLFSTDPTPVTTNSPNPSMQLSDGYFSGTTLLVSDSIVATVRATNTSNQSHIITLVTEGSTHYSYVVSTIPTQQGISGSGTSNYLPKWSGSTSLVDSLVYDSSTGVTIGTGFTWNNTNSRLGLDIPNPTSKLQIKGNGTTNATTTFITQNNSNSVNSTIYDDGTWFFGGSNTRLAAIPGQFDFNSAAGNISRIGHWEMFFRPLQAGSVSLELSTNIKMLNTNVLIGTTTDAGYKLDVNGTTRFNGASLTLGTTGLLSTWQGTNHSLYFYHENTTTFRILSSLGPALDIKSDSFRFVNSPVVVGANTTPLARLHVQGSGSTSGTTSLRVENSGATASLVVLDNGSTGIGTITPTYKLDVFGSGTTAGISSNVGLNIQPVVAPIVTSLTYTLLSGTSLGIGTYYYRVTYYNAIGETSASNTTPITTLSGSQIVQLINIPTSTDTTVIGRKIYRDKLGEGSAYGALVGTITNNTGTTYTDSLPDSDPVFSGSLLTRPIYAKANTTANYISVSGTRAMIADPSLTTFGVSAGAAITVAPAVTLFGAGAGLRITYGAGNTLFGLNAGANIVGGFQNVAMGEGAMSSGVVSGSYNVGLGPYVLSREGSFNIAMGYYTGNGVTGSRNVLIGGYIGSSTSSYNDAIIIGHNATPLSATSYQINIGNTIYGRTNTGNVMIGTTTDAGYKLDVVGTARFNNDFNLFRSDGIQMLNVSNSGAAIDFNPGNSSAPTFRVRGNSTLVLLHIKASEDRIGMGTLSPDASAMLDITSTTKGFLPPRMTNAQRLSIASPAVALMVYCTDSPEGLFIYKSTGWVQII